MQLQRDSDEWISAGQEYYRQNFQPVRTLLPREFKAECPANLINFQGAVKDFIFFYLFIRFSFTC